MLQPQYFSYGFADLFAPEVPLEDRAVRAEEDNQRNRIESVRFSRDILGVDNLIPDDSKFPGRLDGVLHIVHDGDTEHIEVVTVVGVVHLDEIRHLGLAGAAPGSPKIDQDIFALTDIVGEVDGRGLRILRVLDDGEVHERFAFRAVDQAVVYIEQFGEHHILALNVTDILNFAGNWLEKQFILGIPVIIHIKILSRSDSFRPFQGVPDLPVGQEHRELRVSRNAAGKRT